LEGAHETLRPIELGRNHTRDTVTRVDRRRTCAAVDDSPGDVTSALLKKALTVLVGSHYLNVERLIGARAEQYEPVALGILRKPYLALPLKQGIVAD
jgi:hypothetical protein